MLTSRKFYLPQHCLANVAKTIRSVAQVLGKNAWKLVADCSPAAMLAGRLALGDWQDREDDGDEPSQRKLEPGELHAACRTPVPMASLSSGVQSARLKHSRRVFVLKNTLCDNQYYWVCQRKTELDICFLKLTTKVCTSPFLRQWQVSHEYSLCFELENILDESLVQHRDMSELTCKRADWLWHPREERWLNWVAKDWDGFNIEKRKGVLASRSAW